MLIIITFSIFMLLFTAVGLLSARRTGDTRDYLLAGQNVRPWLVALSAVATNNSGYMFIGVVGYTYVFGLSSLWIPTGIILGDFLMSLFIHKKLRVMTEHQEALSFPEVLSKWGGTNYRLLRRLAAIIIVLFLGAYAAAQLNAGSKALHALFGWDYRIGTLTGALIVLLYCSFGGIRASIWTDALQSFIMIAAMGVLFFSAVAHVGGIRQYWAQLHQISENYMNLWPSDHILGGFWGSFLFILGYVFVGLGVIGQPQIMIRFMSMQRPADIGRVRFYYYAWFIFFSALTIGTALGARLLIPEGSIFDAELALPLLSKSLLSEFCVGLVLAGLFASTMSTADSQILSCSASLTRDIQESWSRSARFARFSTLMVSLIALGIALARFESVFSLVILAWSALAAAFGPLLLVYSLGQKVSEKTALWMLMAGLATVLAWKWARLDQIIVEIVPGAAVGLVIFMLSQWRPEKKPS